MYSVISIICILRAILNYLCDSKCYPCKIKLLLLLLLLLVVVVVVVVVKKTKGPSVGYGKNFNV